MAGSATVRAPRTLKSGASSRVAPAASAAVMRASMAVKVLVSGAAKTSSATLSGMRSTAASGARKRSKMDAAVSSTPVTIAMSVALCSCATSSGSSVGHLAGKSHREMCASASESWRWTRGGVALHGEGGGEARAALSADA